MTEQQPWLWEESICTWQQLMLQLNTASHPSLLLSFTVHSHLHSKKRSWQLDASLTPTSLGSSPLFPTHSLSGANMQSISPAGFRGVAVLLLNCYSFLFPSLSCCLSFHLRSDRTSRFNKVLNRQCIQRRTSSNEGWLKHTAKTAVDDRLAHTFCTCLQVVVYLVVGVCKKNDSHSYQDSKSINRIPYLSIDIYLFIFIFYLFMQQK